MSDYVKNGPKGKDAISCDEVREIGYKNIVLENFPEEYKDALDAHFMDCNDCAAYLAMTETETIVSDPDSDFMDKDFADGFPRTVLSGYGLEAVKPFLSEEFSGIRASAVRVIVESLPEGTMGVLDDMHSDVSFHVRREVAIGLGYMKGDRARELLDKLSGDERPEVREAAAEAIKRYESA